MKREHWLGIICVILVVLIVSFWGCNREGLVAAARPQVPFNSLPNHVELVSTGTPSSFWAIDRRAGVAFSCVEWNERGYVECEALAMLRTE